MGFEGILWDSGVPSGILGSFCGILGPFELRMGEGGAQRLSPPHRAPPNRPHRSGDPHLWGGAATAAGNYGMGGGGGRDSPGAIQRDFGVISEDFGVILYSFGAT